MEQPKLISFKKEQTQEILNLIGVKIEIKEGKEVILNDKGQVAKCEVCQKELSVANIGNIAKGSTLLFCDNPYCFANHLAKKMF